MAQSYGTDWYLYLWGGDIWHGTVGNRLSPQTIKTQLRATTSKYINLVFSVRGKKSQTMAETQQAQSEWFVW